MAFFLQRVSEQLSRYRIVIRDQYFCWLHSRLLCHGLGSRRQSRQREHDRGPFTDPALNGQVAAMSVGRLPAQKQPESSAFSYGLCGEKRRERLFKIRLGHAT